MAEKGTTMVLKVDLQCPSCYRKIKKVLAKFPQIRNQTYDERQNTVTIIVVCCSPEKIRDKLCCIGGKTIKSIEIKPPPKPKEPEKPKSPEKPKEPENLKEPEKTKEPEKPKEPEKHKEPEKPKPPLPAPPFYLPIYPAPVCCGQCYEGIPGGPCYEGYGRPPAPAPAPAPPVYVPIYPAPVCCGQCYDGIPGGPCYEGYGRPVPSYDGYGHGGNRAYYGVSRCDEYFNEENISGCTIM